MARQIGPLLISGVVDGLCFYEAGGQALVRRHNPVSGERFRSEEAFAGSRRSCARLAAGSRLASMVYRGLPARVRVYSLYVALKGRAVALLKDGLAEEAVERALRESCGEREVARRGHRGE